MAVKNTTIFVNVKIYQLHVSAEFGHLQVGIQCQRKNYLSDLNAGVQGRGRELVPSPANLHLDQTDKFSSDTVFQPEDGRIRPKHVVGKFLHLQI